MSLRELGQGGLFGGHRFLDMVNFEQDATSSVQGHLEEVAQNFGEAAAANEAREILDSGGDLQEASAAAAAQE